MRMQSEWNKILKNSAVCESFLDVRKMQVLVAATRLQAVARGRTARKQAQFSWIAMKCYQNFSVSRG